jgi:hypothetical protein
MGGDVLLILFVIMLATSGKGSGPPPGPPDRRRVGPMGPGRPMAKSFQGNATAWAMSRWKVARDLLAQQLPPDRDADEVATAVVSHWAIETDWGDDEYNWNLGGIHAASGEPYFASTDAGKPTHFRAYDSLEDGVKSYAKLLMDRYRECALMLINDPESSDWYVCLGKKGYYAANPQIDVSKLFLGVRKRVAAAVAIK